ncbi:unnamed protein product [Clonostachys rosea]|uniref:DUF7708 domain-containing protein n=1 Tax=Bionectria ochroleuca TaxID=29856 RepID=A0ABY6UJ90_BIOOC|nr:unnamed protein product [Clonostachys rosea]
MTEKIAGFEDHYQKTRASVVEWFGGHRTADRADSIAQEAFERARTHVISQLPQLACADILRQPYVSMEEFSSALLDVQQRKESKPTSEALLWLEKLSSRVSHYSAVLDVLVQHHPEYVSLVWGAFKFLFLIQSALAKQQHQSFCGEMVKNLAEACSRIADDLPRADLTLILYPTAAMREAVAHLYGTIMSLIVRAVSWYGQGRLKHITRSFVRLWALEFEPDMREMRRHAQAVDDLAQSASRAELREAHYQIYQTRTDLNLARGEIQKLSKFVEEGFRRMTEFALGEPLLIDASRSHA